MTDRGKVAGGPRTLAFMGRKLIGGSQKRVVKSGSTETFNGTVTVASKQSGGAAVAANIKFTLSYENPSAQAAVMTKDNLSKSAWTYTNDCKDIEKESPNP